MQVQVQVQVAGLWKVAREANFEPEELESLRQELVSLLTGAGESLTCQYRAW